jgi:hypothetical protein
MLPNLSISGPSLTVALTARLGFVSVDALVETWVEGVALIERDSIEQ